MSTVIFDFDGTIADSFEVAVDIFHELAWHAAPIDRKEIARLRGMTLVHVATELKIPMWRIPFLMMSGRRMMSRRIDGVGLIPGIQETIKALHKQGHQLYIMSSNSTQNIRAFLNRHNLDTYFVEIHGGIGLLNKKQAIKKVVRRSRLQPEATYYVGDEARDVEAANRAGLKSIAVSWGYNNSHILRQHHPYELVSSAEELMRVIS